MYHDIRAQKGRFVLRALLWLIFVAEFAQALVPVLQSGGTVAPVTLLIALASLLPSAVVLWALHRGNRAALGVFCLIGLNQIAAFSNWLLPRYQEIMAPTNSLGMAGLVLSALDLILRLSVLYQMFSGVCIPVCSKLQMLQIAAWAQSEAIQFQSKKIKHSKLPCQDTKVAQITALLP